MERSAKQSLELCRSMIGGNPAYPASGQQLEGEFDRQLAIACSVTHRRRLDAEIMLTAPPAGV